MCGYVDYIKCMSLDHHLALIDGGSHEAANLRPICPGCHKPKSAKEHKANSKSKRLAKAREEMQAVLAGKKKREPGKIKSRGFQGHKKFNGSIVCKK